MPSFKRLASKLAKTGFKLAGDLIKSATYTAIDTSGLSTAASESEAIDLLVESFSTEDPNNMIFRTPIVPGDLKGTIINDTLTLEPKVGHEVEIEDIGTFSVKEFSKDASNAFLFLLLRSKKK
jgi:hypothetical protein